MNTANAMVPRLGVPAPTAAKILRFPSEGVVFVNGLALPWLGTGAVLTVLVKALDEARASGLSRVSASASAGPVTAEIVGVDLGMASESIHVALSHALRPDVSLSFHEARSLMTDITGWR